MVKDEREDRIISNIGLVHSIAKRFKNRGAEYEDIFQAGCLGLIKAVDNYDESKGYMFSTYAVPVIMGEIKRIFRDGGAVKVSRSLKEKSNFVNSLRYRFINDNNREPTLSELSEISKISVEELSEVAGIIIPAVSLSYIEDNDINEWDLPVDNSEDLFNKLTVSCLLSELEGKDRKLIYLRYFEGKTQSDTAALLNISQVQVSRREKAILSKLRLKLSE